MASNIPVIVHGNSFSLAIPLQIYIIDEGEMVLEDYTPDPTDEVSVQLKGSRRNYTYTPTIDGNVANIDLSGNELADNYSVVVSIVKANGQRLRSFRTDQFFIVESSDDLTTDDIIQGLEENVIYLNTQCFVAGADGRGITSIVKTSTTGLVDTYTITYSDNTTSTFQVTNGAQGADGVGITSIEKTATVGLVDTYTITMSNGTTTTFEVTNGQDGHDLGLASIINNLNSDSTEDALSAAMGKELGDEVDTLKGITKFKNNEEDASGKYIYKNGSIFNGSDWSVSREIALLAGETINVNVITINGNSIIIGRVKNSSSVYTADAILASTGQTNYSYTATADCSVRITYKTSEGFSAYIDNGYPTDNINERVDTILDRLGGVLIPFDQPKTYTFVNGSLVENAGSLTTDCSTAKLNIADYKALFYSGCRTTFNGYFCAIFFDDNDNYVGQGLRPTDETIQELQHAAVYDMVNVFEEIPQGATKVVLQTNINNTQYKHQVIGFTEVPYNFSQDIYWRQDYYGVKGDATTDDTAALQSLVDNSRGEVSLRQGTYLLGSTLKINTIKLKRFNGNGATFLVNSDITAIELIGSCSDNAGPTYQGETRVAHAGFIIENVTITSEDDTEGTAIYIENCLKPSILNCYIYHINNGIVMNSTCRDINIIGNNIYQCNSYGIFLDTNASLHQLNVSANHISYCKYCFYINDSRQINNFQITGNDLEVSADYPANSDNCCVRIIGDTNTILLGEIEFVGNTIQGHTGSSVIIYAHGGSASESKQVYGLSVIGNFISGCAGNAIELGNFNNIIVANNLVKGVDYSFIKVFDTANILSVNGNTLNGVPSVITTDNSANLTHVGVNSNVATTNTAVTINGASQDYISVIGNTLGGGTVTIGTATHKQEANNI